MEVPSIIKNKVIKRAIDDIALLPDPYSCTQLEKERYAKWIEEFRSLEYEDIEGILDVIYTSQITSIDNACGRSIDIIKIPPLGSLRLNKTRQVILKEIKANQVPPTDERIKEIMLHHVAIKESYKQEVVELDLKLKL